MMEIQTELFGQPAAPLHPMADIAADLRKLSARGVYMGSSSWKYESWWKGGQGPVYVEPYRSKRDFETRCLEEYARVFPSVSGDFTFYNWPSDAQVAHIHGQLAPDFRMAFKCTEFITQKIFPKLPKWGVQAGMPNPDFLNAALFQEKFLGPLSAIKKFLAPIIVEFTALPQTLDAFPLREEFTEKLVSFLKQQPKDFEYGIEMRNPEFVNGRFWETLGEAGATPILNSWSRTVPLADQWKLFQDFDFPYVFCRAIVKPGRSHEHALELFDPYDRLIERNPEVRQVITEMAEWALSRGKRAYLLVNNHLEGCSHATISELITGWRVPTAGYPALFESFH